MRHVGLGGLFPGNVRVGHVASTGRSDGEQSRSTPATADVDESVSEYGSRDHRVAVSVKHAPDLFPGFRFVGGDQSGPRADNLFLAVDFDHQWSGEGKFPRQVESAVGFPGDLAVSRIDGCNVADILSIAGDHQQPIDECRRPSATVPRHVGQVSHFPGNASGLQFECRGAFGAEVDEQHLAVADRSGAGVTVLGVEQSAGGDMVAGKDFALPECLAGLDIQAEGTQRLVVLSSIGLFCGGGQEQPVADHDRTRPSFADDRDLPGDVLARVPADRQSTGFGVTVSGGAAKLRKVGGGRGSCGRCGERECSECDDQLFGVVSERHGGLRSGGAGRVAVGQESSNETTS